METRNSGRVDQWSHCVESRYVSSASGTDISTATEASSLDCHFCGVDSPPAVELNGGKGDQWISWTKPFVQGWTHTGRRLRRFFLKKTGGGRALSKLRATQKALERQTKQTKQKQTKRARKKDRSSYEAHLVK